MRAIECGRERYTDTIFKLSWTDVSAIKRGSIRANNAAVTLAAARGRRHNEKTRRKALGCGLVEVPSRIHATEASPLYGQPPHMHLQHRIRGKSSPVKSRARRSHVSRLRLHWQSDMTLCEKVRTALVIGRSAHSMEAGVACMQRLSSSVVARHARQGPIRTWPRSR